MTYSHQAVVVNPVVNMSGQNLRMQQSTYCIKLITEFQDSGSLKLKRLKEFHCFRKQSKKERKVAQQIGSKTKIEFKIIDGWMNVRMDAVIRKASAGKVNP